MNSNLSEFSRVQPGSTVVDVFPGKGDWTRTFSEIVGPEGRVYAFVPAEVAHLTSGPTGNLNQNVEVVTADMLELPSELDVVWLNLFYHDLHTPLVQARGATADSFNRAVHARLKPGGFYVIVDHVGVGDTSPSLHRIDPAVVRAEVERAGFVLDEESRALANSADPHTAKVFDASIKGKTDRFAYRFRKA